MPIDVKKADESQVEIEERGLLSQLIERLVSLKESNKGKFFFRSKVPCEEIHSLIELAEKAKSEFDCLSDDAKADLDDAKSDLDKAERLRAEAARLAEIADRKNAEALEIARGAEEVEENARKKLEIATSRAHEAKIASARANDRYDIATRQMQTVDDARAHRDNSHRELSLLQGEVIALARSFKWDPSKAKGSKHTKEALRWLSENVTRKEVRSDEQIEADSETASRLARFRYLSELEAAESNADESDVGRAVRELISSWRVELGE